MKIVTKNFKSILMLSVSAFIFFSAGVKYEQIKRHRQEVLIFANLLGEEIVTVHRIIESFNSKSKDEVILDYNLFALTSIGCSLWLDYLSDFETKDMESFFTGIDMALEKFEFPNDNKCVNNLLDMRR